ncbi:hypothetical protein [Streptomyces sp. MST-110588]|uniref:hypothetical protein n=1 Tax=Streptomyces sp. MST-110588 TaxID=2833628 RepID=UPI001F5DD528|nr:hypothetical protein [Streptomyces sp. MST-110588]UNO39993.1 hypothetical protein KGS77_10810 [Streptomyces sp. MST-110588]
MEHEMRAEYAAGASAKQPDARVRAWHMVRGHELTAMCGRELDQDAETQSADLWGTADSAPFCHSCGAMYLREVP